ncbi:MAG: hypothetical protein HOB79_19025, partial [Rhodospirillaceae bacterium]|nr:hypothetical protein [Rhodospirillaceae bacterium]
TRDEIGSIKDSGSAPVLFALTPITIFAPADWQERLAKEELLGGNAGRLFFVVEVVMAKLMGVLLATLVLATLAGAAAEADMRARTTDGKDVLLKDNGTWNYIKQQGRNNGNISFRVVKYDYDDAIYCDFSLELRNNTGEKIDYILVRFAGYDNNGIIGDGFSAFKKIRKGKTRTKRTVTGMNCTNIRYLKLLFVERCKIGGRDISDEACLELVRLSNNNALKVVIE